jgi:ribonucleoside-diphosphate reductase alpha chain
MMGWQSGCKGMTVYRDGSRSGVLVSKDEEKENKFTQCNAPKRLKELVCDIHSTSIVGEQYIVLVGLYNNKPYELFSGLQNKIKIPRKYKTGKIVKNSKKTIRSTYDLIVGEGDDELVVSDIVEQFDNSNNLSLCRMVSLSLRHGASPKYVVEQLQKNKDSDFYSFTKGLARIVKGYISDGESANGMLKACPDCGQEDGLVYQGGCIQCSCGWSKCD